METHCTSAKKLILPSFQPARYYSLTRKHDFATFVNKRLRFTLLDQSSPTSEIEWLCVDVDGYEIFSVYKPLPMRLQSLDLPLFPHPYLHGSNFNCHNVDWGYDNNCLNGECLAGWENINYLAFLYNAKMPPAFTPGAGTLTPIQIQLVLA